MAKKNNQNKSQQKFHLEFLNPLQKLAWSAFQQSDVLFMAGSAGTGKTFLATAFAVNEILRQSKSKIILTRPIVEAGEKLGYLPGTKEEKVDPYMAPFYDCLNKLVGYSGPQREMINSSLEIAPLAFLRGRTFDKSICILDEAQNCSMMQLKLFLTRLGKDSKMIVTGDPLQSDIQDSGFIKAINALETVDGISIIKFDNTAIVRHPIVGAILDRLP